MVSSLSLSSVNRFKSSVFQLRYLQTLNSISAENNSTIIFPIPIDIISQLMGNPPQSSHQVFVFVLRTNVVSTSIIMIICWVQIMIMVLRKGKNYKTPLLSRFAYVTISTCATKQTAGFSAQIMQNMGFSSAANISQDKLPEKPPNTCFLLTASAWFWSGLQFPGQIHLTRTFVN